MSDNVDFIARCIAGSSLDLAKDAITNLGGLSLIKISKEDYDTIDHDPDTIYFVVDGDKITQYIGDNKLSSGAYSGNFVLSFKKGLDSIIGRQELI